MTHTPFLKVEIQRTKMDCAVACLAMLTGGSYEEALLAFRHPKVLVQGARWPHIKAAAKRLGRTCSLIRTFDLETDTGLLCVASELWPHDHIVVLKEGLIVDTDATIWEVDCFMSAYKATAGSLLVLGEG